MKNQDIITLQKDMSELLETMNVKIDKMKESIKGQDAGPTLSAKLEILVSYQYLRDKVAKEIDYNEHSLEELLYESKVREEIARSKQCK